MPGGNKKAENQSVPFTDEIDNKFAKRCKSNFYTAFVGMPFPVLIRLNKLC